MSLPDIWGRHILVEEAASVKALNRREPDRLKDW